MRWGKEAMTCSHNCQSNDRVGLNGFQSNRHARHVFGVRDSYCIISNDAFDMSVRKSTIPTRVN